MIAPDDDRTDEDDPVVEEDIRAAHLRSTPAPSPPPMSVEPNSPTLQFAQDHGLTPAGTDFGETWLAPYGERYWSAAAQDFVRVVPRAYALELLTVVEAGPVWSIIRGTPATALVDIPPAANPRLRIAFLHFLDSRSTTITHSGWNFPDINDCYLDFGGRFFIAITPPESGTGLPPRGHPDGAMRDAYHTSRDLSVGAFARHFNALAQVLVGPGVVIPKTHFQYDHRQCAQWAELACQFRPVAAQEWVTQRDAFRRAEIASPGPPVSQLGDTELFSMVNRAAKEEVAIGSEGLPVGLPLSRVAPAIVATVGSLRERLLAEWSVEEMVWWPGLRAQRRAQVLEHRGLERSADVEQVDTLFDRDLVHRDQFSTSTPSSSLALALASTGTTTGTQGDATSSVMRLAPLAGTAFADLIAVVRGEQLSDPALESLVQNLTAHGYFGLVGRLEAALDRELSFVDLQRRFLGRWKTFDRDLSPADLAQGHRREPVFDLDNQWVRQATRDLTEGTIEAPRPKWSVSPLPYLPPAPDPINGPPTEAARYATLKLQRSSGGVIPLSERIVIGHDPYRRVIGGDEPMWNQIQFPGVLATLGAIERRADAWVLTPATDCVVGETEVAARTAHVLRQGDTITFCGKTCTFVEHDAPPHAPYRWASSPPPPVVFRSALAFVDDEGRRPVDLTTSSTHEIGGEGCSIDVGSASTLATLTFGDARWRLTPVAATSSPSVWVNGVACVQENALVDGDMVEFGGAKLRFDAKPQSPQPLAPHPEDPRVLVFEQDGRVRTAVTLVDNTQFDVGRPAFGCFVVVMGMSQRNLRVVVREGVLSVESMTGMRTLMINGEEVEKYKPHLVDVGDLVNLDGLIVRIVRRGTLGDVHAPFVDPP